MKKHHNRRGVPGKIRHTILTAFMLVLLTPLYAGTKFDVVVYGGTAGGVLTAVAAAREGLKVALLEPRDHLGGMMSGGLSCTDYGKKEVIGGYSLEFFWRAGNHYRMRAFGQDVAWYFEPHVAEQIFREMAQELGVTVYFRHRLLEKKGVKKNGARITEIVMENGSSFEGKIFADGGDFVPEVVPGFLRIGSRI